jgi:hypothetical protein
MANVEFLRDAFALVNSSAVDNETIHVFRGSEAGKPRTFCSCMRRKGFATCNHADALLGLVSELKRACGDATPSETFLSSLIYHLLEPAIRLTVPVAGLRVSNNEEDGLTIGHGRSPCLEITGDPEMARILLSRLEIGQDNESSRGKLMRRCRSFSLSDTERILNDLGRQSIRQSEEDSFWFRVAYHCFLQTIGRKLTVSAAIDGSTGDLGIVFGCADERWKLAIIIPREAASKTIHRLLSRAPDVCGFSGAGEIREIVYSCIFSEDSGSVQLQAFVRAPEFSSGLALVRPHMVHDNLVYIPETATVVELSQASIGAIAMNFHAQPPVSPVGMSQLIQRNLRSFSVDRTAKNDGSQLDLFSEGDAGNLDRIIDPPVITAFDRIELEPDSIDDHECRVRIFFSANGRRVAFADILAARSENRRFAICPAAIVDMCADGIMDLPLHGRYG